MPSITSKAEFKAFFDRLGREQSSALVMDYDGTLAPFHVDRDAAYPYSGVQELISNIMANGRTRVVLVSGRSCESVRSLLDIQPAPEIWGVHGLQRMLPNGVTDLVTIDEVDQRLMEQATSWLHEHGFSEMVESKHGSIAVHWRGMSRHDAESIHAEVRSAWTPLTDDGNLSLLEFDEGIELRVGGHNKGSAVITVLEELAPRTPFAFLGDDNTDEDAFEALKGTDALTVLVRSQFRATHARAWLRPPRELLEFLSEWLERAEA